MGRFGGGLVAALALACEPAAPPPPPAPDLKFQTGRATPLLERLEEARIERGTVGDTKLAVMRVGGVARPALSAHAPSQVTFPFLPIHESAHLELSVGIADREHCPEADGVRFRVLAGDPGGEAKELWSHRVAPSRGEAESRWHHARVDLSAFAGHALNLVLETDPIANPVCDSGAWAWPVLHSAGMQARLASQPVARDVVARDLLGDGDASGGLRTAVVSVESGSSLSLAGEIIRAEGVEGEIGPVTFVASLAGRELLRRQLSTWGDSAGFDERIPLGRLGANAGKLQLRIEAGDEAPRAEGAPERARAHWTRALLYHQDLLPRAHASAGPNLLVILVDTLRADHLGVYGYARETSPFLDRFAERAVVFEDAISPSSWTLPAVASLMTGVAPPRHGMLTGSALDPTLPTLAEQLQAAGLTTFGLSASPIVGRREGLHRGFESFLQFPWIRGQSLTDMFRIWLEEHADLRWFAYLHYMDVHDPYEAPEPYGSHFAGETTSPLAEAEHFQHLVRGVNFGQHEIHVDAADLDYLRDAYDGEIRYWDAQFGELLEALGERGVLENTIVVVTSDHGEEFLEHGKLKHGPHLYDESIRVPLLIRAPGRMPPGRRQTPAEVQALVPTLLRLLGVEPQLPGEDLIRDPGSVRAETFSLTDHALAPGTDQRTLLAAVRDGDWKLTWRQSDGAVELYDLRADPAEQQDQAAQRPEVVAYFLPLLEEWLGEAARLDPTGQSRNASLVEKLRELGYVH